MGANAGPAQSNRALAAYDAERLSPAFRRAAALDFGDVAENGALSLASVLAATKEAFVVDEALDLSLFGLGASLEALVHDLVDACGLEDAVRAAATSRGKAAFNPTLDRRAAAHQELTAALLLPCDILVDPEAPVAALRHANKGAPLPPNVAPRTIDAIAERRLAAAATLMTAAFAAMAAAAAPASPPPPPGDVDRAALAAAAADSFLPPDAPTAAPRKKKGGPSSKKKKKRK